MSNLGILVSIFTSHYAFVLVNQYEKCLNKIIGNIAIAKLSRMLSEQQCFRIIIPNH